MSDCQLIGPNACGTCGGEYGEHENWCTRDKPNPTPTQQGGTGFVCECCQRQMELRIDGKFCNECYHSRRAAVAGPRGDALLSQMWQALIRETCINPVSAKTVVFLGEEKFRKALAPFAATSSPAPAESLLRDPVQVRVLPTPIVTRDGVQCEDQAAALEEFKDRCRAATPSNRARRAAMELSANGYIDRDLLGEVSEQRLQRVIEIIKRVFAAPVDNDAEAQRLLTECCYTIQQLAEQQAMPDNFYERTLQAVGRFLEPDTTTKGDR